MKIATRGSDLALWQAHWVRERIERDQAVKVELVIVKTRGDREPDRPIRAMDSIGFFSSEIEQALLDGEADAAVHSYKDLPTAETPGLSVAAVPSRGAPEDWLLVRRDRVAPHASCWPLQEGARVGTSSARRMAQLLYRRPDLAILGIRGNVPTRIQRVREGAMDAVVLARAGLDRLGLDLSDFLVVDLRESGFLPAPAQGALAVQCRADDAATIALLSGLHDPETAACVQAERHLLSMFQGGCSLALGCLATLAEEELLLQAAWLKAPGDMRFCTVTAGPPETVARLAHESLTRP